MKNTLPGSAIILGELLLATQIVSSILIHQTVLKYVCFCVLRLNVYLACSYFILEPGTLYLKEQSHFIQKTPKFPDLQLDDCRLKDLIILWNTSFYIPMEYFHKNRCQDDSG